MANKGCPSSCTVFYSPLALLSALPDGTESDEVRFYTIAYGEDANSDVLTTIANRTNGQTFVSTPENISDIYFLISSEF